jgi:hypothetical protein
MNSGARDTDFFLLAAAETEVSSFVDVSADTGDALPKSSSWGRFDESVSAVIYGQNLNSVKLTYSTSGIFYPL